MGAELLRLLLGHPRITVTGVTSERLAGEPLGRAYPHLRGLTELAFHDLDAEWLAGIADAVFLALPHLESQRVVPVLRRRGVRAIDLSADYRLRDPPPHARDRAGARRARRRSPPRHLHAPPRPAQPRAFHHRLRAPHHDTLDGRAPRRLPRGLRRRAVRPRAGRGRAADDARCRRLELLRRHGGR